jgi:tetratricopeptide (TPR) repeat protein
MMDGFFDYTAFREALGASADLLEFFAVLIGAGTTMFVWLRRRTDAKLQEANHVQRDIYEANLRNDRLRAALRETVAEATRANRARKAQALAVPTEVWEMAGGETPDTDMIQQWLDDTRDGMAQACGQLGEWYAMHARAPVEDAVLPEAEARAALALALRNLWLAVNLDPGQAAWRDMAEQLGIDMAWADIRAGRPPETPLMLPAGLSANETIALGQALQQRIEQNIRRGRYWDALLLARQMGLAAERGPGAAAAQVANGAQYLMAYCWMFLGQYHRALEMAKQVYETDKADPERGPDHPNTLRSQFLVAHILMFIERHDEALPLAREVWKKEKAHPDIGPDHPSTLSSQFLVAQILNALKRHDEALPLAREVWEKHKAHPEIGPDHPDTLHSQLLVAQVLMVMERHDEALPLMRQTRDAARELAALQTAMQRSASSPAPPPADSPADRDHAPPPQINVTFNIDDDTTPT